MTRRVPAAPEFAVAQAVQRLLEEFQYPDDLGGGGPALPSGGGGTPTIGVAASNASQFSKDKADYQCTGASDQVVIMEAMGQLYAAGGGRLWLSEGLFDCAPDVIVVGYSIAYPVPILMIGMGEATRILFNAGITVFGVAVASNCHLRDMRISPIPPI